MYEGVCVIQEVPGEPAPLIFVVAHNLTDHKTTDAVIEEFKREINGRGHVVPFRHMLEHTGRPRLCMSCKAAIEEELEKSKEVLMEEQRRTEAQRQREEAENGGPEPSRAPSTPTFDPRPPHPPLVEHAPVPETTTTGPEGPQP